MSKPVTQPEFLKDVIGHQMYILADQELVRCLRFKQPNSSNRYFDINTWPGHLCISGDMGTFVFSRLTDMFEFFRDDKMYVNYRYWGEKLESISRHGGYKEFDSDLVKQSIKERVDDLCCNTIPEIFERLDSEECASVEELEAQYRREIDDFLMYADLGEWRFVGELEGFESSISDELNLVQDCDWDWLRTERLSYCYQWCCHAIVWAIKQYDRHHNPIVIPSHYQALTAPKAAL